jgi:CheY-like chemotaxis protein
MSKHKGTILLADDEEQVRGILAETLKTAGYLGLDAGNYYEALKFLEGAPKGPWIFSSQTCRSRPEWL